MAFLSIVEFSSQMTFFYEIIQNSEHADLRTLPVLP